MPPPSGQNQSRSTQGGSIQLFDGLMVSELSGCDERQQDDQNEMMSRDDSQVPSEVMDGHKCRYAN